MSWDDGNRGGAGAGVEDAGLSRSRAPSSGRQGRRIPRVRRPASTAVRLDDPPGTDEPARSPRNTPSSGAPRPRLRRTTPGGCTPPSCVRPPDRKLLLGESPGPGRVVRRVDLHGEVVGQALGHRRLEKSRAVARRPAPHGVVDLVGQRRTHLGPEYGVHVREAGVSEEADLLRIGVEAPESRLRDDSRGILHHVDPEIAHAQERTDDVESGLHLLLDDRVMGLEAAGSAHVEADTPREFGGARQRPAGGAAAAADDQSGGGDQRELVHGRASVRPAVVRAPLR